MSSIGLDFPGLPANLLIEAPPLLEQDGKGKCFSSMVSWSFFNTENEKKPNSLIYRVQIWGSPLGIDRVFVIFKAAGCEEMKKAFSKMNATIFHHHDHGWCQLAVKNSDIRTMLTLILRTQKFENTAKSEMEKILQKV